MKTRHNVAARKRTAEASTKAIGERIVVKGD
jgi:hypothetical protein